MKLKGSCVPLFKHIRCHARIKRWHNCRENNGRTCARNPIHLNRIIFQWSPSILKHQWFEIWCTEGEVGLGGYILMSLDLRTNKIALTTNYALMGLCIIKQLVTPRWLVFFFSLPLNWHVVTQAPLFPWFVPPSGGVALHSVMRLGEALKCWSGVGTTCLLIGWIAY